MFLQQKLICRMRRLRKVFQLQSECGVLGKKLNDSHYIDTTDFFQDHISRYDPTSNRCFVTRLITNIQKQYPPTEDAVNYAERDLYDAQTGEMLAIDCAQQGRKWGMLYDTLHKASDIGLIGCPELSAQIPSPNLYNAAHAYIDKVMASKQSTSE